MPNAVLDVDPEVRTRVLCFQMMTSAHQVKPQRESRTVWALRTQGNDKAAKIV